MFMELCKEGLWQDVNVVILRESMIGKGESGAKKLDNFTFSFKLSHIIEEGSTSLRGARPSINPRRGYRLLVGV